MQQQLLINGKRVEGQGSIENIINPENGDKIAEIHGANVAQVDEAVMAAEKAMGRKAPWLTRTVSTRSIWSAA